MYRKPSLPTITPVLLIPADTSRYAFSSSFLSAGTTYSLIESPIFRFCSPVICIDAPRKHSQSGSAACTPYSEIPMVSQKVNHHLSGLPLLTCRRLEPSHSHISSRASARSPTTLQGTLFPFSFLCARTTYSLIEPPTFYSSVSFPSLCLGLVICTFHRCPLQTLTVRQ